MQKTAAVLVTSITGNTDKVADALAAELEAEGWRVIRRRNREALACPVRADLYLIGFWTRKSGMNDMCRRIVGLYRGQPMLVFGTLGNYPTGDYADLVRGNARQCIEQFNRCLGVFLCQGKIPEERTEKRRQLPKTAPHYLDDEGYARHLESRKHPNEQDLADAAGWLRSQLTRKV